MSYPLLSAAVLSGEARGWAPTTMGRLLAGIRVLVAAPADP